MYSYYTLLRGENINNTCHYPVTIIGYGVFGNAYEPMFSNDLHDIQSVEHSL
jgi:hypothetical protein